MVKEVKSKEEFKALIEDNKLVVVDFYAQWCGPCINFSPKFDAISSEFPNVLFIKVDIDENSELQALYTITSIPCFKIFKDGNLVDSYTGANESALRTAIKNHV